MLKLLIYSISIFSIDGINMVHSKEGIGDWSIGVFGGEFNNQYGDKSSFNYRGSAEYTLNMRNSLSVGVSEIGGTLKPEFYFTTRYNAKDDFFMYFDGGYRISGDILILGLGLQKSITKNIKLNSGYRYYSYPNKNHDSGDAHGFELGITYDLSGFQGRSEKVISSIELPESENYTSRSLTESSKENDPTELSTDVKDISINSSIVTDRFNETCDYVMSEDDLFTVGLQVHTVTKGDWIYKIAKDYCSTPKLIKSLNKGLYDYELIFPGDRVIVPIKHSF
ncbi:LysM peptidoglycan-binding domain-containing protein [Vibrio splendidus]|uniref:LysM peptidoglycan-binding domain-containing protein n=1 Tax=Vibrio splendidus TaxID=29497 RepID=UPI000D3AD785|nr:LysM peptidoglycan-binding domain-containing protein [Vibrio splendidus]PTP50617.1 hypothetical protein CWO05_19930 [Vibrio splendidus]